MDLAELKNMDVKDVFAKFKGSANILSDKKLLLKFGIGLGFILILMIAYYFFDNKFLKQQNKKIEKMEGYKTEIETRTSDGENSINYLSNQINELKPLYENETSLFHTDAEFDDLYKNITIVGKRFGLSIDNIQQENKTSVHQKDVQGQNIGTALYDKLSVTWKITGTYLGYLKYRKAISKMKKHINFDKETIATQENGRSGQILAEGTISIVQLPE